MVLLAASIAFITGVYLGFRLDAPIISIVLIGPASAFLAIIISVVRKSPLPALVLVFLVLGIVRVEAFPGGAAGDLSAHHSKRPQLVEGVVVTDPEPAGSATRFRFRIERISKDDRQPDFIAVSAEALVILRETTELALVRERPYFRYGDRLLLNGTLLAPEELEDFDYPGFLAQQGIGSVMSFPDAELLNSGEGAVFYEWLFNIRRMLADSLSRSQTEPQASFGQALLLGLRDELPDDLVEQFRLTGTSHILAISGLHVGVMLGLSMGLSRIFLGRHRHIYLMLPLVTIWFYAFITGASPSVVRAAIMGSVVLAAYAVGRPRSMLPALGLAALLMVLISPGVLRSVSFQLSFSAVAGIGLLMDPISRRLQALYAGMIPANGIARLTADGISTGAAMTLSATIATLPLTAFYFERVSLVGLPATLLVLPALPFVLISHAATALVGLVNTGLAQPFSWAAWVFTDYVINVVELFSRLPGASYETRGIGQPLVWVYYGLLILALVLGLGHQINRRVPVRMPDIAHTLSVRTREGAMLLVLIAATAAAVLMWTAAFSQPDDRLHVYFIDVGQGDAIFIKTPGGQQILVDGGRDPSVVLGFLGDKMPFRDRTIELVVLTHAHNDHINGLTEVLRRYNVERILERQTDSESPAYYAWRSAVLNEGASITQAQSGQIIGFDDGVYIQVLNPHERLLRGTASDVDNASVVLRLVYGEVSFLLTGDMFSEAERALVARNAPIEADVLKVGHHGSRSSSSSGFLDMVGPAIAVISAGEDNRFGHPHEEVVEALRSRIPDELIFVTGEYGTIEITTDGKQLDITTEREP